MIALIINGLLLVGFGVAARSAEVMVLGPESRATLLTDRDLSAKRCRYSRPVSSMLQAQCHDLGYEEIPRYLKTDVQILDFTKNRLRRLKNDTLSAYTSLAYLYLQDNFILSIEEGAFSKLSNLQVLDLSRNAFPRFPMSTLALPLLRRLYLSSIDEPLEDSAFESTSSTEDSNLEFLELSNNRLTRLPSFGSLPMLTYLNVSGNRIESVSSEQLAAFCSLEILDVTKNPLRFGAATCDCASFNAWIKTRGIKVKPGKIVCDDADDAECAEFSLEVPSFSNDTTSAFESCRGIIRARAESAKARSTWILVASCAAASLVCLFVILCCIHKRNSRKKKRQRLKQQKEQQLAANNANTELLNGNMPPEQT